MATFSSYASEAVAFGGTLSDIIPAIPNINVRWFYDSTASEWKGATGDGSTDDYAVIAAAITEAATTAGPNIVYFPAGDYKIGTKLDVEGVQVIASPYAKFIPGSLSMTMVEMKKNSSWDGGYFYAVSTNFTGIMMLLDGSTNSLWLSYLEKAPSVRNVLFYGGIGVGGGGTGIKLLCSSNSTKRVTFSRFSNITLVWFATGILIESGGTAGYVNGNTFTDIALGSCTNMITINGGGTLAPTFNEFSRVVFQPSAASPASDVGIKITNGDFNIFSDMAMGDSDEYNTAAVQIVSGLRNKIKGEGMAGYTLDTGNESDIDGEGGPIVYLSGIAGETVNRYNAVYLKSDGKYWNSDADAATTMPCAGLCSTQVGGANVGADAKMRVIKKGLVYFATWNWSTIGGPIYASTDPTTTNGLTETKPSGSGDQVQQIGTVISADSIYVDVSMGLPQVEVA